MGLLTMLLMSIGVNKAINSERPAYNILKVIWGAVAVVACPLYIIFGLIYLDTVAFLGIPIAIITTIAIIRHNTSDDH